MAITFKVHTSIPHERVVATPTNFSPHQPQLWPMLAPELHEVYLIEPNSADVQEGSIVPAGFGRVHYE